MLPALLLTLALAGDGPWPAGVETALVLAGANRPEIEHALEHFAACDDPLRLRAACFLVENMPGHGFIPYGLFDAAGNEVPFDALAYPSFAAAQAALDALEERHGTLDFHKKELVEDLHVLQATDLIRNVELAFEAWESRPWARTVTFETFCENLLPYRGSNEPVEDWRGALLEALAEPLGGLTPDASVAEVAGVAARAAAGRVGFSTLYYLHPTDQGFAEMSAARRGRCEDITNMTTYAMRAAGVVSAADYTPWWGHRDNNHAWPVTLDGAGHGSSADGNGAAKVYRKTYSSQRENLCFQLAEGEEAPPWLDRATYIDVTEQYGPTADVSLRLTDAAGRRFAYLCVFNGGEWRPIHWGRVAPGSGAVTFEHMGLGLLYLPATYADAELHPAAPPFFLSKQGEVQPLEASQVFTIAVPLYTEAPRNPQLDESGLRVSQLAPDATYELFVWRNGWESRGAHMPGAAPLTIERLPAGGLYWLVREGSRRLERPFSVRDGAQVFF